MRSTLAIFSLVSVIGAVAAAVGCSSNASTPATIPVDSGTDAAKDATTAQPDSAADAAPAIDAAADAAPRDTVGVLCPDNLCGPTETCCATAGANSIKFVCKSSCAATEAPVKCDGPEDCAGNGVCCASVTTGPGNLPACPTTALTAACNTTCVTDIKLKCAETSTVRPCHAAKDCMGEADATDCCEFETGDTPVTFCAPSNYASVATRCFQ